ncbi:hypothetical protein Tco_1285807 [Tanacetum coccineum]
MSNMSEDIQYAGSDTRPPMLDRTDFESWQQRIRLYCLGKDNGENIMKSIIEGPERDRVFTNLTLEEKDRYKADIRLNSKFVNNMLPEWSRFITEVKLNRGLKESNFDQLYAYLKQHEVHANENKMMLERFTQTTNDPLALMSNASVQQTSSNIRNKDTVQDGRVVVQDVRGRYNANNQGRPFQRNNARGVVGTGNVGDLALNVDHVFEADQCDAFDSDVDEAPTAQTMFMVNISSKDPIYNEARPSYDSDIPSEVQDYDNYSDSVDEHHNVHVGNY